MDFVCLGVLCDLYPKNVWVEYQNGKQTSFEILTDLPLQVREWAGMNSNIGYYGRQRNLAECNDGYRGKPLSFKQIANIIERNMDKL